MNRALQIVSFDYPYPPNYGGVMDVFYKIKALYNLGVKVHLHYFADAPKESSALAEICESINFYPKSNLFTSKLLTTLPMRMLVRQNADLVMNLAKLEAPILYEGLHTSHSALMSDLMQHKKYLRCHNAEAEYAAQLGRSEQNLVKKIAFKIEAFKTKTFERNLAQFDALLVLTDKDSTYFKKSNQRVVKLPIFHAHQGVETKSGVGDYVLFHGNLSVNENYETANWIIQSLAPILPKVEFVIAGKYEAKLPKTWGTLPNVSFKLNPNQAEMKELIQSAQIILLKTAVPSGIKLKLIDSLALGRHIISDQNTIANSDLEKYVHQVDSTQEFAEKITALIEIPIASDAIHQRNEIFEGYLNNELNAKQLIAQVF